MTIDHIPDPVPPPQPSEGRWGPMPTVMTPASRALMDVKAIMREAAALIAAEAAEAADPPRRPPRPR